MIPHVADLLALAALASHPRALGPKDRYAGDLTNPERNSILRFLKQQQPDVSGLRRRGMTAAQATRYLAALERDAERFAKEATQ